MTNITSQREKTRKSGRKRAVIAGGALLGVAALATTAAFTDYGLLNLNGSDGFGGSENAYNLQFSSGQETSPTAVAEWIEANPDAVDVAPVEGADALVPGGAPIYVNLPVQNVSKSFRSTLNLTLTDQVGSGATPADKAYQGLLRFDIAQVDDASTTPTTWAKTNVKLSEGVTPTLNLSELNASDADVVVVKAYLVDGDDQSATNAANGGSVKVQAKFDGQSIN